MAESARASCVELLGEKVASADMAFARSFAVDPQTATRMVVQAMEELEALLLGHLEAEGSQESHEIAQLWDAVEERIDALQCRLLELVQMGARPSDKPMDPRPEDSAKSLATKRGARNPRSE